MRSVRMLLANSLAAMLVSVSGLAREAAAEVRQNQNPSCRSWESFAPIVDGALDNAVKAIAARGKEVFVGGAFLGAGNEAKANYIARWDGQKWHAVGEGLDGVVTAVALSDKELYVGGRFTKAGNEPASGVARWDGSRWHSLGKGVKGRVSAIAISGTHVYVGGDFELLDEPGKRIFAAQWDGKVWKPFGKDLDGPVNAIAATPFGIYLGGEFRKAGNLTVNHVVRWDGTAWHSLAEGLDKHVNSIVHDGRYLFVGGAFESTGDKPVKHVARWDGSEWKQVGTDSPGGEVLELAASREVLYAAGRFPKSSVVAWDGRQWRGIQGAPMYYELVWFTFCCASPYLSVEALGLSEDGLLLGGSFTNLGGNPKADYVAMWDGKRWRNLGESTKGAIDGHIFAIAGSGEEVYVAGQFSNGGGLPNGNNIVRWDGSKWQALGNGLGGTVYSVMVRGKEVIAGGRATVLPRANTGGVVWDGKRWKPLADNLGAVPLLAEDNAGNLLVITSESGLLAGRLLKSPSTQTIAAYGDMVYALFTRRGVHSAHAVVPIGDGILVGGIGSRVGLSVVPVNQSADATSFGDPIFDMSSQGILELREPIVMEMKGKRLYQVYFGSAREVGWKDHPIAEVTAMTYDGTDQVFLGVTYSEQGEAKYRILKYTLGSAELEPIGPEMDGEVAELVVLPNKRLLAAGEFKSVGGNQDLRYVAQWDGKEWKPIGGTLNGRVSALAIVGDRLLIGGEFTNAGGDPGADRLAVCRL